MVWKHACVHFVTFRKSVSPLQALEALQLKANWLEAEMNSLAREGTALDLAKTRAHRILLLSSWRSGSSFVGGLLDSHPGEGRGRIPLSSLYSIPQFTPPFN